MPPNPFDMFNDRPSNKPANSGPSTPIPYPHYTPPPPPPPPPLQESSSSVADIPPLNEILPNPSHRADLALLVSAICERMRDNLQKTWDCMQIPKTGGSDQNNTAPPQSPDQEVKRQNSRGFPGKSNSNVSIIMSRGNVERQRVQMVDRTPSPPEEEDLIVWEEKDKIDMTKSASRSTSRDEVPTFPQTQVPRNLTRSSTVYSDDSQTPSTPDSPISLDAQEKRRRSVIATAQLREMKTKKGHDDAFENFDKWVEGVQRRVFEVVNSRDSGSGRSGKRNLSHAPRETEEATVLSESDQEDLKVLQSLYPPIEPSPKPLLELSFKSRESILHSLLLLLLSLEHYDARSRVLLHFLSSTLALPPSSLLAIESTTATTLISAAQISATAESQKAIDANRTSKRWKVGLASVAGAAVIGLTGGLAAPLVAAGIGGLLSGIGLGATVAAGYLGAVAGSGAIVGALFGAYGGKMTGEMVERYATEVEDFAFIPLQSEATLANSQGSPSRSRRPPATTFDQITSNNTAEPDKKLLVTIGISGWLTTQEDITRPWRCLSPSPSSLYALRFDPSALLDIGTSLDTLLESYGWRYVQYEIITRTVLATLYLALWPLALVKAARVIDNPYSVARKRAEKAGRVLADALCNRVQGERPVNLIGFGLGARVLYYAMQSLAQRGAWGIVQDVYFLGAPVPSGRTREWAKIRAAAAGRVVNAYSGNDWVLGFLERGSSLEMGVAGLQAIEGVWGVENVNLGGETAKSNSKDRNDDNISAVTNTKPPKEAIVEGHARYGEVMGIILRECGLDSLGGLEEDEVFREKGVLEKLREKTRKDMEAVEKEEIDREIKRKEKKAQKEREKEDMFSAMKEAMRLETERRKVEDGDGNRDGDEGGKEDEEERPPPLPVRPKLQEGNTSSSSGSSGGSRQIGDWTETGEGIDDVVERIERELMERRRRRAMKE